MSRLLLFIYQLQLPLGCESGSILWSSIGYPSGKMQHDTFLRYDIRYKYLFVRSSFLLLYRL